MSQAVREYDEGAHALDFGDICTLSDQLQIDTVLNMIIGSRSFYVHIRLPAKQSTPVVQFPETDLNDAWYAEVACKVALWVSSLNLFVTIELESGTRLWSLKPYPNLKLHKQFIHVGDGLSLLTHAPWVTPLFSVTARRQRKVPWSKLGIGKRLAPLHSEQFCDQFVALLFSEAQSRRAEGKSHNFRPVSSSQLLGWWPSVPLYYTTGQAEEDRIASVTDTNDDDRVMAPSTKDESRAIEREREKH